MKNKMLTTVVSGMIALIPRAIRNYLYRFPVLSSVIRKMLTSIYPADHLIVGDITVGPLKGTKLEINFRNEKYFWLGTHEPEVQAALQKTTSGGEVAYDIGAYIGFFTLLLAARADETGQVYAFEPNPDSFRRLVRNVQLNHFQNIRLFNLAVSDRSGEDIFQTEKNQSPLQGHLFTAPAEALRSPLLVKVQTVSLDDFVFGQKHLPPAVIKIDVEGAELRVIAGMRRLLKSIRPLIICEVHTYPLAVAVKDRLQGHGYIVHDLEKRLPGPVPATEFTRRRHLIAWPGEKGGKIIY